MKEWFFIAYNNVQLDYCEWEIVRIKHAFLKDKIKQYVKFSGIVVQGTAFRLSAETGKPIFSNIVATDRVPF